MRFLRSLLIVCLCLVPTLVSANETLIVMLDTSGSMGNAMRHKKQRKIDAAREALSTALAKVNNDTNIGILTFTGWVYPIGPYNKEKLEAALNRDDVVNPATATPLWAYMKIAADELFKVRKANGNAGFYKLLVVTDGEADDAALAQDHPNRPGYLTDILRRGIMIDCIGVMMEYKHELATKINGFYVAADDPDTLMNAVNRSVAEVGASTPDVATECYDTIKDLPPTFALSALQALSRYENQPLGESAPIEVVQQDGTITTVTPHAIAPPSPPSSGGGGWVIIAIVAGVALVVSIVAAACKQGY